MFPPGSPGRPRTRPRTDRRSPGCGRGASSGRSRALLPGPADDRGRKPSGPPCAARVAGQDDVFPASAMMSAPCAVHGPIPGTSVSAAISSSSAAVASTSGSSRPSDSRSARSRKRADLSPGQAGVPELRRIGVQHFGRRREPAAEARFQPGDGPHGSRRPRAAGRRPGTAARRTSPSAAARAASAGGRSRAGLDELASTGSALRRWLAGVRQPRRHGRLRPVVPVRRDHAAPTPSAAGR